MRKKKNILNANEAKCNSHPWFSSLHRDVFISVLTCFFVEWTPNAVMRPGDVDGANMPWSPELSFWWNPLTSTHRLSSLFFSPAVEALVCELFSCYIFAIASNTPTTWSARCFGASPAVGARGALMEDKRLQQDHGRYRNNNISAPGWTMIKSRLECMCERSFTVRRSMFHRELFFCHKPQSSPEWMYSSPKWTKQPESNWEQL